jgi:hypothetical protein
LALFSQGQAHDDDWCCGKGEKIGPYHIHPSIHPSIFHPCFSCPKTNDGDDLGEMTVDKIGTHHITFLHPSIYHPYYFTQRQSVMMMMMMI